MTRIPFLIALLCACLQAQAGTVFPDTGCSLPAVGYRADGTVWPADGVPKAADRMQVTNDQWHVCQPWVKTGEKARPADAPKPKPCKDTTTSWSVGENVCTATLQATGSGFSALATQEMGSMRGQATYVCTNGNWQFDAARSNCAPAPGCDLKYTITYGTDNACTATYDARSKAARLTIGDEKAVPADAKPGYTGSATLRCEGGTLVIAASRCTKAN